MRNAECGMRKGEGGEVELCDVFGEGGDGVGWGVGFCVEAETGEAFFGEVDGCGGGDVGEGERVSADSGAEVVDVRGSEGGEALCFVLRDGGVGGLFERFGQGPEEAGVMGEFLLRFGLDLVNDDRGMEGVGGEEFSQGGDDGDGEVGGGFEGAGDLFVEWGGGGGVEEFESFEGDGGVVGDVWGHGEDDTVRRFKFPDDNDLNTKGRSGEDHEEDSRRIAWITPMARIRRATNEGRARRIE
jgi:hypothetical protein